MTLIHCLSLRQVVLMPDFQGTISVNYCSFKGLACDTPGNLVHELEDGSAVIQALMDDATQHKVFNGGIHQADGADDRSSVPL